MIENLNVTFYHSIPKIFDGFSKPNFENVMELPISNLIFITILYITYNI